MQDDQSATQGAEDFPIPADASRQSGLTAEVILRALEREELFLAYQPQVDAMRGGLVGFEALLRWQSPALGAVSPSQFIPVAETTDVIHRIWDFILASVAADRDRLSVAPALHVAVNLSASQLPSPGLAQRFEQWLHVAGLDSSQIHVEITESSLLTPGAELARNLAHLKGLGVSIWLDDFGTGFSSLKHLRDLPISGLKVDRSFVMELEQNLSDFRIVSAIVAMANSLGLRTVAEGVETQAQAQILTQLGCDVLQGYLIGRPESVQQLREGWMQQGVQ